MLAVISNQHLTKNNIRRKAGKCKTAHSSPPDCETRNIVSTSDGVPCAKKKMEQFFKVMLALVMTVILISTLAGYLKENYSSFDIQDETTETTNNEK